MNHNFLTPFNRYFVQFRFRENGDKLLIEIEAQDNFDCEAEIRLKTKGLRQIHIIRIDPSNCRKPLMTGIQLLKAAR